MAFLVMFLETISSLVSGLLDWLLGWWWFVGSPSCTDMPGKELSSSVHELQLPEGQIDMEIIFFHGLDFGEPRDADCRAWMSADGCDCWPQKWLPERFPGARILAVSYDASALKSSIGGWMDVEVIAENLVRDLILCNDEAAGQGLHCPVVLVGHSVGGLVMNQLCCHAFHKMNTWEGRVRDKSNHKRLEMFLRNLRGMFYYSTPHVGSSVAKFAPWYKRRGSIMKIMDFRSGQAAALHMEFKGIRQKYQDAWKLAGVVESHETNLLGFSDVVVEITSARFGNDFGEHTTLGEDHFSICRPKGRTAAAYQILVKFLIDIQEHEKPEDIQSISQGQDFLIDLESRVQKIKTIMQIEPRIGLYGMGGVGKTTLAKAVLQACHLKFDYSCWVSDLKEVMQRKRGTRMKACILEGLLKRGKEVSRIDADWDILRGKKVLFVIDNVDSEQQLRKYQIPPTDWFGKESRVIVTSRDKGFCTRFGKACKVEFLSEKQSEDLFLHHAFEKDEPPPHVKEENLKRILKYCGGVPLAIEVIGRTLYKETNVKLWKATIQKLEEGESVGGNRDECLLTSLRISYDRLCIGEQKMFLDSALLLMDEPLSKAIQIWEASWGCGVRKSWKNLICGCLVDAKRRRGDGEKRVWVHDALRMLAQNITCPKHDGSRMHKWYAVVNAQHVMELLTDSSQEPCKAEGLIYEPNCYNRSAPSVLHCQGITPTRFPHLRLLTLVNVQIWGDAVHLPSGLVYLRWSNAMSTRLPFLLRHLTKLCWLDLRGCQALESIPGDVNCLTALTRLELRDCGALTSLPDGIGNLTKLCWLDLRRCKALESIPEDLDGLTALTRLELRDCRALISLPNGIGNLAALIYLGVENSGLRSIPYSLGKLTKLRVVEANSTPLVEMPFSILNCQWLSRLNLSQTSVSSLPESFGAMRNLHELDLSKTRLDMLPASFTGLGELSKLRLSSTPLRCLPEAFGALRNLDLLDLSRTRLEMLPESFIELCALRRLYLTSTPLRRLPEAFGSMTNMRRLWLDHSRVEELPTSFTRLEKLSFLRWHGCKKLCLPDEFETLASSRNFGLIRGEEQVISGNLPGALRYLDVDYRDGLFDADGSAADAVVQGEIAPKMPSASASERTSPSGEASDRAEGQGEGYLPLGPAIGAPRASARYLFEGLREFEVQGNANLTEFPQPLLHALSRMKVLERLTLTDFHAVRRLPEDFGDFLANSRTTLHLDGWTSLEEFPESLGRLTKLKYLVLNRLDKLERLPQTLQDLSELRRIYVHNCKNVRSWPARGIGRGVNYVSIDSWALLGELVEQYGHLPHLERVRFNVKWEDLWRVEEAVESWNSRHTAEEGQALQFGEWYRGERVRAMVEVLATVYGGDSAGTQGRSGPSAPPAPPAFALLLVIFD